MRRGILPLCLAATVALASSASTWPGPTARSTRLHHPGQGAPARQEASTGDRAFRDTGFTGPGDLPRSDDATGRHTDLSPLALASVAIGGGAIGSAASQAFAALRLRIGTGRSMAVLRSASAKNPDVNPQHTRMVFEAYPGFTWIMNIDGSGARPLSPTTGGGWMEPRFAPDGLTVVTTHDIGAGHQEIFAIDVASGAARQLTAAPQYPWKWRPSIDPSGSRLIATYGTDSNRTSGPASHVGVATLGHGVITDFTSLTPVDRGRPSYDGEFSPDGRLIIFDAGSQIWVAAADGRGAQPVATGKLGRFDPLTPGHILFTHDVGTPGTNTQLWASATDGSGAHLVADGNFAESFAAVP